VVEEEAAAVEVGEEEGGVGSWEGDKERKGRVY
jgi:hypothetical protein